MDFLTPQAVSAFFQVIAIDLVLAGDNAVVIGLAAAGLPKANRGKVILIGILSATVLRILFAVLATQFLRILGLVLAGGILLLWVTWKMWRELRQPPYDPDEAQHAIESSEAAQMRKGREKTFGQAVWQIVVADLSMSLDNVLAVAGAARDHPIVLAAGLVLSVALMGFAASLIARLLHRHRWIAYIGLLVILYVALDMIFRGMIEVWPVVNDAAAAIAN